MGATKIVFAIRFLNNFDFVKAISKIQLDQNSYAQLGYWYRALNHSDSNWFE